MSRHPNSCHSQKLIHAIFFPLYMKDYWYVTKHELIFHNSASDFIQRLENDKLFSYSIKYISH